MESPNLEPESSPEDLIETHLRSVAPPPIPDDGFTRQVLARIAPRSRRWPSWILPGLGAALGLFLVLRHSPAGLDLETLLGEIETILFNPGFAFAVAVLLPALVLLPASDEAS